jgi:hypothetical protein
MAETFELTVTLWRLAKLPEPLVVLGGALAGLAVQR